METKEVKDFIKNSDNYQILTIEKLINNLNELNLTSINIKEGEIWKFSDKIVKVLWNDYENPILIQKDNILKKVNLTINPQWYQDNKEKCDELFRYICEHINRKKFEIKDSEIIDTEIINSLCKNKNLEEVILGKDSKIPYILSEDDYLKFKNSTIKKVDTSKVAAPLKENFDKLILCNSNKNLISYYKYENLQTDKVIFILQKLTEEELENLKYLSSSVEIKYTLNDYDNLLHVITRLNELNKENKLIVYIKEKEKFNKWIVNNNINYNDLYVELGLTEYPIKEYLKFEKMLYDMVKSIDDLSPFEKYIYIYNITKNFKLYKENDQNKREARDLYSILINEYMVCVGFSYMLEDLMNKQNIESCYLSVDVDTSYDNINVEKEVFEEEKTVKQEGHARRYVHIVDEKYGIDGFYIADPTWDNDLNHDYYNYLAITNKEATKSRRYIWTSTTGAEELLNINSIEEFYQKINFLNSRESKKHTPTKLIKDLIERYLVKLDSNYITTLKGKYPYIDSYNWPEDINNLIYEIGEYLVSKLNKPITGKIIMEAVRNVYKKAYDFSGDLLNEKMDEIITHNKEKQEKTFPIRYKINADGSKEIIMNEKNKFDLENNVREM